jgi:anti-anti-sigma factor
MKQAWSETLRVEVSQIDNYPCVRLTGEGEGVGARLLERTLRRLIEGGHNRLVLDTRDVRFLDQRCYEALEAVVRMLEEEGGRLVVVDQSLPVERTLKLLHVERLAPVVNSISQATSYLEWRE